jgi:hypothetical protein
MAIDLDFFEKGKEHTTIKKIFKNPYKDILDIYEHVESISTIIPEEFIKIHTINIKNN